MSAKISRRSHRPLALVLSAVLPLTAAIAANASEVNASEVKVSSFGYDSEDSTEFIQKALASGAKKVILDRQAGPWYTLPLKMPSNIEFVLEPGVELVAKRGAFRGIRDYLLELSSVTNVIVRGGEGSALRMWKCDYQKPPYEPGEWRHALTLRKGCRNILVENLRMLQSGGDGIGVSGTDITIRNCVCDGNHRQGMSVFSAENLLVENCVFSNTSGTAPQAGVDLEPDHGYEKLKNIVFRNCVSYGNAGAGFLTCLIQLTGDSAPVDITFENCRSWSTRLDTVVVCKTELGMRPVTGQVRYVNCAFGPSKLGAVKLHSIPGDGLDVSFEDTVLTNSTDGCAVLASGIVPAQRRMDGVDFGKLTVFGDGDWFRCDNPGTGPVTNVTGDITVVSSNGARRIERIDGDWVSRNLPVFDGGRPVPGPAKLPGLDSVRVEDLCPGELAPTEPVTILSSAPLIFFADKPGICRFAMRQICAVPGRRMSTGFLTIAPVEGGKGERFRMPGAEPGEVAYNASHRGFYRIVPPKGMKTRLRIDSTSVPVAIDATRNRVKIAAMKKRPFELQFAAAGDPFTLVAYGDGYYRFGVSVLDAKGGQRESDDMVDGLFVAHGEKGDAPGFCKVRFCPASQPHFDHVGLSLHGGGGFFFLSGAKKWR